MVIAGLFGVFIEEQKIPYPMKFVLIAVLICLPAVVAPQQTWLRAIPDVADSQEVDLSSITAQGEEWVGWTRSDRLVAREFPPGTKIEPGSTHYLRMAVRCKQDGMAVRVVSTKLVGPSGSVEFESSRNLDSTYQPMERMEYRASAPGLICAAALAQKHGKKLPWPMKKSEFRSFIDSTR